MKRPLLDLLTALSLVLCVALVVLWVRSYWVSDQVRVGRVRGPTAIVWWQVYSAGGTVGAGRLVLTFPAAMSPDIIDDWAKHGVRVQWNRTVPSTTLLSNLLVGWIEEGFTDTRRVDGVVLQVPYWMVAAATGAIPGLRYFAAVRRLRRRAATCCPACGYDLRATPGRCPECGTAATTPA